MSTKKATIHDKKITNRDFFLSLGMALSARHLSACMFVSFHVSARGAIMATASANSRRLSQQNPYKTCVSLVELGQTSRHFLVHFEKIPTKIILRYGRCAEAEHDADDPFYIREFHISMRHYVYW